MGWHHQRVEWQKVSRYKGIDRFIYELRGETIMSELNIQFVIADGTIQIKDQVSK
jgi:hypothetical protein